MCSVYSIFKIIIDYDIRNVAKNKFYFLINRKSTMLRARERVDIQIGIMLMVLVSSW